MSGRLIAIPPSELLGFPSISANKASRRLSDLKRPHRRRQTRRCLVHSSPDPHTDVADRFVFHFHFRHVHPHSHLTLHIRATAQDAKNTWPSFRGPGASGIAHANLPAHWDVSRNENIKWKTPIEGLGHGGPVVWQNKVFLVTAVNPDPQPVKTGVFGDIA